MPRGPVRRASGGRDRTWSGLRKERVLRLSSHQNTASRVRTAVAVGLIGGLAALGGGCNVPSFIDPGETAGLRQEPGKEPLVVSILDDLDPVLEEGNRQFVTAQPPRAEDLTTETV